MLNYFFKKGIKFIPIILLILIPAFLFGNEGAHESKELGAILSLWWTIPFAGILLSIALFPLLLPDVWHHHFGKISLFWGLVLAIPFLLVYQGEAWEGILETALGDYVPFLILLWALYVVGGGIVIRGSFIGTPKVNTLLLFIGAIMASFTGTTGASMILIRPLLRANKKRVHKVHTVVFFIFLVSNIGGLLTPLGDPPLFMGFLHGVPFFWTMTNLIPEWLFANAVLLSVFFVLDSYFYKKEADEAKEKAKTHVPVKIAGSVNFIFLIGIVAGVLFSGFVHLGEISLGPIELKIESELRDLFLITMGFASLYFTPKELHEENGFTWVAIEEVAILFASIFITMIPAIEILRAGSEGHFAFLINAIKEPYHYFWSTGILSSFLDNTPTYLTFFNTAQGAFAPGLSEHAAVQGIIAHHNIYLKAIATGAVFMGANTYIGNAPNFMVKSIAEESGIAMPSFFGYIFKYSLIFLIPVFILITIIFF